MRFYNRQHRHCCGIDLHVKTMYVCILDATGQVLVHRNVKATPAAFLEIVAPYRDDLVVAAECTSSRGIGSPMSAQPKASRSCWGTRWR
jgi:predicted NBD/HSP70 family sugar kinase